MIVTENRPRIVHVRTGEIIPLREKQKHVHIGRVDLVSDGAGKGRGVFGFCAEEANCSGDMCLYVWCLMHNEGNKLGDEREVCALDVDVKVGGDSQAGENEKNMMQLTCNTGVVALRA